MTKLTPARNAAAAGMTNPVAIKVITFDLDNTLWDVKPTLIKAEKAQNQWLEQYRPLLTENFSTEDIRNHRLAFWKQNKHLAHQISELRTQSILYLLLQCGYSNAEASSGATEAFAAFLEVRQQVEPYPEAMEVLAQLAKSYRLGALTNGNADIFKIDLGRHFEFAYTAEQVNASKPQPGMFHAAMQRTGVSATSVIHVGDDPEHDIGGAQQAGVFSVWMNTSGSPWSHGVPAHAEIANLKELPAAIDAISHIDTA